MTFQIPLCHFLCLNIQSDSVVILSKFSDSNANVVRSKWVVLLWLIHCLLLLPMFVGV